MHHPAAPLMDFRHIISGFQAAVAEERIRQKTPDAGAASLHSDQCDSQSLEILANTYIEAVARTPFSTRIRQGFLLRRGISRQSTPSNMQVGHAGRRDGNRVRTREGVEG